MINFRQFFQQLLCTLSVYLVSFLCGAATTWLLPATRLLIRSEFDEQVDNGMILNNLENLVLGGRLLCSLICYLFVNDVARRTFIVASVVVHALAWCLLIVVFDIRQLLVYQFAMGIAIAFHQIISYVYLAEVTSPRYRAFAIACDLFTYALGVESYALIEQLGTYSLLCTVALTLSIVTIAAMYYTLESPYYLMMHEKQTEAMLNLSILNTSGTAEEVINLFKDLEKYRDQETFDNVDFYKSMTTRGNFKVFLFIVVVNAVAYVNFCGAVTQLGEQGSNLVRMVVVGLVSCLLSIVPMLVLNRRVLLLVGFTLVSFLQLVAVVLFYVGDTEYDAVFQPATYAQVKRVLPLVLYGLYVSVIYPTVCTLRGELLPYAMKIRTNSLIEMFQLSAPFAVHYTFSPVTSYFGVGLAYTLNALLSWLIVLYVYVYYRDTSKKSLLQIRDLYRL